MRTKTILVVDDDCQLTEGLSLALEEEGLDVIVCHDVESAELVLERAPVSIILSDVKLSGPFGYEGLDFVRTASRRVPASRIALMTGCADPALRLEAMDRGAWTLLEKPFDVSDVTAILEEPGGVQ